MGTKVSHFLEGSIPCAVRALETDPRIAARKVATFGAAKALDASAATRSAGAVAGRRPVDAGLTGSRRRLLRLWLRRLSRCRRLLNLRQLSRAGLGERIVVNGNERNAFEIRLIVHRHQRVIRHDESPTIIADTLG